MSIIAGDRRRNQHYFANDMEKIDSIKSTYVVRDFLNAPVQACRDYQVYKL